MFSRYNLQLTLAVIGIFVISGCSNVEPRATDEATSPVLQGEMASTEVDAILKQADMNRSPQKEHYLLRAAYDFYYEGDFANAERTLALVDSDITEMGLLIRQRLLMALLAEKQGEPQRVIEALQPFEGILLGDAQQAKQLHRLQIYAYRQLHMPQQEAEARIGIMAYLNDDDARLENYQELLDIALELSQQLEMTVDAEQKALLQQQFGQLLGALEAWRYRYSQPMSEQPFDDFTGDELYLGKPGNIAVLLPLTGRHAKAAEAIRNGLLSAYYTHTDEPVTLTFYDTQGKGDIAWQRYHQALSEGAEMVIGPLTKEAVNLFASSPNLDVPVLALNRTSEINTRDNGLYQFTLSPENEATQTAIHAWNQGLLHPVVLVPDNNWGRRIQSAFSDAWQLLGGEIASEQRYDPKQHDFSKPIRAALELELSDQRLKDLRKVLRESIKFTPRRRQDVDFIFIAAQPRQARQLKPQLKFHYAGDLPVFSTSHAYRGKANPQLDHDMDGITFGDTPWTLNQDTAHPLRQQILAAWPKADEKFWRLYAMGIDAFELTRYIQARPSTLNYYGETGHLQLSHGGRLYRHLLWATFRRGVPSPIKQ